MEKELAVLMYKLSRTEFPGFFKVVLHTIDMEPRLDPSGSIASPGLTFVVSPAI